jgi:tetratricopeptide (TPR) repeat protein
VSLSGRYDEAARELETAIRLDPRLFEARYFYGRAAFQEGRLDEALRLFEEACHVREDYQARLLWAQCYAAMGARRRRSLRTGARSKSSSGTSTSIPEIRAPSCSEAVGGTVGRARQSAGLGRAYARD